MPFMPDVISQSHPPEKMSGTKIVPDLLGSVLDPRSWVLLLVNAPLLALLPLPKHPQRLFPHQWFHRDSALFR